MVNKGRMEPVEISSPEEELEQVLRAGDRIHLEWPGSPKTQRFLVDKLYGDLAELRVQEDDPDRSLEEGLTHGSPLTIFAGSHGKAYSIPGRVDRWIDDKQLEVWIDLGSATPIQRRNDFRMNVQFPLMVDSGDLPRGRSDRASTRGSAGRQREEYSLVHLRDLSAGGCLCKTDLEWLEIGTRHRGSLYLDDDPSPMELRFEVVRRETEGDATLIALRFLGLTEPERQRITGSLFTQYRRWRAFGSESS